MKKVLVISFLLTLFGANCINIVVGQGMEGAGNNYTFITENQPSEDTFLLYLAALAGPIVALIGIILTLPILRKRLIETHISTALSELQMVNSQIQRKNQQLIDNLLVVRDKAFRVPN